MSEYRDKVIEKARNVAELFLFEIAKGTSQYLSLHNLTRHVQHQYHGRFLIELLQNSHDALYGDSQEEQRIEIAIREVGPFGALYIANDGRPFSESNFDRLSNLGQSDKNPQSSIGNKGIGFRSVLEITEDPQVFSRSARDAKGFDGFCFGFSPTFVEEISSPLCGLLEGDDLVKFPRIESLLVEGVEEGILRKFRESVHGKASSAAMTADDWLRRELSKLSPYLLPFPVDGNMGDPFVSELEQRGFSTVVRLPFKSRAALELAKEGLQFFQRETILFLEKVNALILDDGKTRRELKRTGEPIENQAAEARDIALSQEDGMGETFRMWSTTLDLSAAPSAVRTALDDLPGEWSAMTSARISLAVNLADAKPGRFSIFLPTKLPTGSSVHINAPFFGDMSRTSIAFGEDEEEATTAEEEYNGYLLRECARLAIKVAASSASEGESLGAKCIFGLLLPCGDDLERFDSWLALLKKAAIDEFGLALQDLAVFPADTGWVSLRDLAVLPPMLGKTVVTEEKIRRFATFPALHNGALPSMEPLRKFASRLRVVLGPSSEQMAETVEALAADLASDVGLDWWGFWRDLTEMLDGKLGMLAGREVLIGTDGRLHSGGGESSAVFLSPDGEDAGSGRSRMEAVPRNLRGRLAFLAESISNDSLSRRRAGSKATAIVDSLIEAGLVRSFDPADILETVVIPAIPVLPAKLDSKSGTLCRDLLRWGLSLVEPGSARTPIKGIKRLLAKLPVPCSAGWFPAGEASFGAGWGGTSGAKVERYLDLLPGNAGAPSKQKLLVPPDHPEWNGAPVAAERLKALGVFDGLRAVTVAEVRPGWSGPGWPSGSKRLALHESPPPGISKQFWGEYRDYVWQNHRTSYQSKAYYLGQFSFVPGADLIGQFNDECRAAFMEAMVASMANLPDKWWVLVAVRYGGLSDIVELWSPLRFALSESRWLRTDRKGDGKWWKPSELWHVSSSEMRLSRGTLRSHLRCMPQSTLYGFERARRPLQALAFVGLRSYGENEASKDARLLDDLMESWTQHCVSDRNAFISQLHFAWECFAPTSFSRMPSKLPVVQGEMLAMVAPSQEEPCYLPDDSPAVVDLVASFGLRLVEIPVKRAKALRDSLVNRYPQAVKCVSKLAITAWVDDEKWRSKGSWGSAANDDDLSWLLPVVLTLVAHHGEQGAGTRVDSFEKLMARLREMRVARFSTVEVSVDEKSGEHIRRNEVSAYWHQGENVLIVSERCIGEPVLLAATIAGVVGDEDIEHRLRSFLSDLSGRPDHDLICFSLRKNLRIPEAAYLEVRDRWFDDVALSIQRIWPLIEALSPNTGFAYLTDAASHEELVELIDALKFENFDTEAALKQAKDAPTVFEFAAGIAGQLGVTLSRWNEALATRKEPPLVNRDASTQFKDHLASAKATLKAWAARRMMASRSIGNFKDLAARIDGLSAPSDASYRFWEVSFRDTMDIVRPVFVAWGAADAELAALDLAPDHRDLISRMGGCGIDSSVDPVESERKNNVLLDRALADLQRIGSAFAWKDGDRDLSKWRDFSRQARAGMGDVFESDAYGESWTPERVWTLARTGAQTLGGESWRGLLQRVSSLEELRVSSGLTAADLERAREQIEHARVAEKIKRAKVSICGEEFDMSDDNAKALMDHIESRVPAAALAEATLADLAKPHRLSNLPARWKRGGSGGGGGGGRRSRRQAQEASDDLTGFCGEIHVYRWLGEVYSRAVVSSDSWISSYAGRVFPENEVDDGAGCDFRFTADGVKYHLEVKSSTGSDESFLLGASEIELAKYLAGSKRHGIFRIVRVIDALSESPRIVVLPNPYEKRFSQASRIDGGNVWVRFKLA
ncbi:hypothetical protein KBB96_05065 [Luteolibacter ambystomatis]|uniref:Sacsin/Nov domain-containing protein n=1 Tax=Luteolibacter ambystomatis TaxID=2824561 RepID=A0A975J1F2_9BACT|nr:hypothetical protein [Luteolibacter ambystomatis]QUE52263.1 hypothetical protein KBB96_05065 [Luteolibacter ambystomatis]